MTNVGAAITPTSSQTWVQAISAFETLTGEQLDVRRCYDGAPVSSVNSSQLKHDVGTGRKSLLSMKPTMSTSISTLESFAADVQSHVLTGDLEVDVIIYHEPVDNMSGSSFVDIYERTAPYLRACGIPVGMCFTNYSVQLPYNHMGSSPTAWNQSALVEYVPNLNLVDFVAVDEYCAPVTPNYEDMGTRARRITQFALANSLPLTLAEFGVRSDAVVASGEKWMRSVTDWALNFEACGGDIRDVCYFHSDVAGSFWLSNNEAYKRAYQDMMAIL